MSAPVAFPGLVQLLNQSSTRDPAGTRVIGAAFLECLFSPEERLWFQACRTWVNGGPGPETAPGLSEILECLDIEGRTVAALHLNCARILRDTPPAERAQAMEDIAKTAGISPGLAADLAEEMGAQAEPYSNGTYVVGSQRPVQRAQHITALLVDQMPNGDLKRVLSDLCVELIPNGSGAFYPAPEMAFVSRDDDFLSAEIAVVGFLKSRNWWPEHQDVRWRLVRRDGRSMSLALGGASLGGCFGLALLRLLAEDHPELSHLAALSLAGAAITAALDLEGNLLPTAATGPKLLDAPVHTVIVSARQSVEWLGLEPDQVQHRVLLDPRRDLHVIKAGNLLEALTLLQTDLATRWRGIDCTLPPRNPDFVGRDALFERLDDFIRNQVSGYLLIEGGMGRGKTSLMTEFVHRRIVNGRAPIYHFISSYTAPGSQPDRILACFCDRLRHKYGIPELGAWASLTLQQKFEEVLLQVSRRLTAEGRKEVLVLEAADQTELPRHQSLVPGFFSRLPPNILCIISARPSADHVIFGDDVTVWDVNDCVKDREDILLYLQRQNGSLNPPLPESFLEQIVAQEPAPTFFSVATCVRELRAPTIPPERDAALRQDASEWNHSPEELVNREITRRLHQAELEGISEAEFWLTIGLLAVARAPLSLEMLEGLGILPDSKQGRVLALCSNFFEPRLALRNPHQPYTFAHPGYIREIIRGLREFWTRECHRRLAEGCQHAWRDLGNPACYYARQYRLSHLRRARLFDALAESLTDFNYLESSLGARPGADAQGGSPEDSRRSALSAFDLIGYFNRSLPKLRSVHHPLVPQIEALSRAVVQHSHPLQQDPSLLAQIAYNELSVAWGPDTLLGRQIREAVCRYRRPWLRRLNATCHVETPAVVKRWSGHESGVTALVFSPADALLASAGRDQTVRVWDVRTGQCLELWRGHEAPVTALALLPKGTGFVSSSTDGTVRIWPWRGPRGGRPRVLRVAASNVFALAVSPDGSKLATGGDDSILRIWDLATGRLFHEWKGHRAAIRSIAFSPGGDQIATGAEDSTLRIGSLKDGRVLQMHQDTWVHALAFSPKDRVLISGGGLAQGFVRFWNPESGECLRTLPGHAAGVCCLAFSADGQRIASGSYDRTVLVRDAGTGTILCQTSHAARVHAVAFSPEGDSVASAGDDRLVKVTELPGNPSAEPAATSESGTPQRYVIYAVRISASGRFAVSGGRRQPDQVWDFLTGAPLGSFRLRPQDTTAIALSSDSQLIASGSLQEVCIWTPEMARLLTVLKGHESWVLALEFSPTNDRVVSGSEDHRIMLWEAASGRWIRTFSGHTNKVRSVTFSRDGRLIASGAEDGTARIWEADTGHPGPVLTGHEGYIVHLAFLRDHRTLVSAGTDETVRVWDVDTGKCLKAIKVSGGEISALGVSPDGRFVATGGVDDSVGLWDLATGQRVASTTCQHEVLALSFATALSPNSPESPPQPILRIADAGGASHVPNFYTMEIVGLT